MLENPFTPPMLKRSCKHEGRPSVGYKYPPATATATCQFPTEGKPHLWKGNDQDLPRLVSNFTCCTSPPRSPAVSTENFDKKPLWVCHREAYLKAVFTERKRFIWTSKDAWLSFSDSNQMEYRCQLQKRDKEDNYAFAPDQVAQCIRLKCEKMILVAKTAVHAFWHFFIRTISFHVSDRGDYIQWPTQPPWLETK